MSSFDDYNRQSPSPNQAFAAVVDADALRTYVQRVYAWMVGGLMTTAITAWVVAGNETLLYAIYGTPLMWVVMLAPLALVWILSSRLDAMKPSTAAGMFIAFSILIGMSLASIFIVYTTASIFQVFFIAAGMYAVAAVFGYTTKRDLTSWGSFLFMGLIGLILASLVGIFFNYGPLQFAINVIGVIIFTGLTAYDMQRIKEQAVVMYAGEAFASKRAIVGALSLYLDFINLFLFLLRLLGNRR